MKKQNRLETEILKPPLTRPKKNTTKHTKDRERSKRGLQHQKKLRNKRDKQDTETKGTENQNPSKGRIDTPTGPSPEREETSKVASLEIVNSLISTQNPLKKERNGTAMHREV